MMQKLIKKFYKHGVNARKDEISEISLCDFFYDVDTDISSFQFILLLYVCGIYFEF